MDYNIKKKLTEIHKYNSKPEKYFSLYNICTYDNDINTTKLVRIGYYIQNQSEFMIHPGTSFTIIS